MNLTKKQKDVLEIIAMIAIIATSLSLSTIGGIMLSAYHFIALTFAANLFVLFIAFVRFKKDKRTIKQKN